MIDTSSKRKNSRDKDKTKLPIKHNSPYNGNTQDEDRFESAKEPEDEVQNHPYADDDPIIEDEYMRDDNKEEKEVPEPETEDTSKHLC